MPEEIEKKAKKWLSPIFDFDTQKEVKRLLEEDPKTLQDAFYKNIEFGTSGLRGIMGAGTNRINQYTFGKIILGFANYLKKTFLEEIISVVIAYDVRNKSEFFAKMSASIFSSCGIKVHLFDQFCPTPLLSFAIKELQAKAGVMITASHNPPEYNGCKLYWKEGGQIVSPYEEEIMQQIKKVSFEKNPFEENPKLISFVDKKIEEKFIEKSIENSSFGLGKSKKKELKILFSPLHGTAIHIAKKAFESSGFFGFQILETQASPDGNFPTVFSPNPEEKSSFELALNYAKKNPVDLILASDPDADRLGVGIYDNQNRALLLNGNQTNTLLSYYLLEKYKAKNLLTPNHFIATTKVSSDIFFELAKFFGVKCKVSLTGFKWIVDRVNRAAKNEKFIGGGEESFGFMVGDFIRDKDAITSMLLMAELAAELKANKSSLFEKLLDIYIQFGLYYDHSISKVCKGEEGNLKIQEMMKNYRENPLTQIDHIQVIQIEDYLLKKSTNLITKTSDSIDLPSSNLLIYRLSDGSKISIRPSGTEPKIKFYFNLKAKLENQAQYPILVNQLENKIERIKKELKI